MFRITEPSDAVAPALSVLSRPRFLCSFTVTGLACEEMKRQANNGHPYSKSARKVQQKMMEDVRAAAEIASKQKHSPAREHLDVVSSIFPPNFVSGMGRRACWFGDSGPADSGHADADPTDIDTVANPVDSADAGPAETDMADTMTEKQRCLRRRIIPPLSLNIWTVLITIEVTAHDS